MNENVPDQRRLLQEAPWPDGMSRRKFLQLMGASLALGGLGGCMKQPDEKIVPYVKSPEIVVPGEPLYFATAITLGGYATGVIATSHMGRPTKLEGNPEHPASLGATDIFTQASILTLYDPDRSQVVTNRETISTWSNFLAALERKGDRIRFLTGTVTSPTLGSQLRAFLRQYPEARWHQYEPVNRDAVRKGSLLAFGEHLHTQYRLEAADVIVSLDGDFLVAGPGNLRYAREFADRRTLVGGKREMSRLYVVESSPTVTGSSADHRLGLRAPEVGRFARALARLLDVPGAGQQQPAQQGGDDRWMNALADDLRAHRGRSIILTGPQQPPEVHAIVHGMNDALGNVGKTLFYTDPVECEPVDETDSLTQLVNDMEAGAVDTLVILGGNPVYDAPADLSFGDRLSRVGLSIRLGMYEDETSALCDWHIPEAHSLESWGDALAFDGTATIIQPLIAPLYDGKSSHELIEQLMGHSAVKAHDVVRNYWKERTRSDDFEAFWNKCLNDGMIAGTALPSKNVALRMSPEVWVPPAADGGHAPGGTDELEANFRPDPTLWDGRFANNGWLQELPKPLTRLTWDNAALIGPGTAARLGLEDRDLVELHWRDRSVKAPVLTLRGQPEGAVTIHLGYGRTRAGKVGSHAGFNAYAIRSSDSPWSAGGLVIRKTGEHYPLAITQEHHTMEGRNQVRSAALEEYKKDPSFAEHIEPPPGSGQSLYPAHTYDGYAWGMSIDLNSCIGCNACVIACQAENNIPIVGKEQVQNSREMHWIRIDTYLEGETENPRVDFQPVPCMHCENAPCELVCPVGATVHDSEGLNVMVYNRCIGTRYCSNNCPYKVRRFNFYQFADNDSPTLKMLRNPDVTVRSRGVMEKCTYCLQRISAARIKAEEQGRPIHDGEVVTACQAACPTKAIVFGDINDPHSVVASRKSEPREYSLLGELNTKPRTTYLAKVTNPNPEIKEGV